MVEATGEVIVVITIVVVVLALATFIQVKENPIKIVKEKLDEISWDSVKFNKDITPKVDYYDFGSKTEYTVKMQLDISYSGKLSDIAYVIPVIKFKDKSAVAAPLIAFDPADPNTMKFDTSVEATMTSSIPIIIDHTNNMGLVEGQTVIKNTGEGMYAITVSNFHKKLIEIITDPLSLPCWVTFSIEDEKTLKSIDIKEGGEELVDFGNGYVKIKNLQVADCKKATFEIDASGGERWEVMDTAEISFWKHSECTATLKTYDQLFQNCIKQANNDYLGGMDVKIPLNAIFDKY